jgi:hypothetical protein
MWEMISFAAGMLVLMLLFVLLPHVIELPDAIAKYFRRRAQSSEPGAAPAGPEEAAARLLGDALRRAQVSSDAAEKVTAAFWAANAADRLALAHMIDGRVADGPVEDDDDLLAVVRGLRAVPGAASEADKKPASSTAFSQFPECPK